MRNKKGHSQAIFKKGMENLFLQDFCGLEQTSRFVFNFNAPQSSEAVSEKPNDYLQNLLTSYEAVGKQVEDELNAEQQIRVEQKEIISNQGNKTLTLDDVKNKE